MTPTFSGFLLALFGLSVILITLSLLFLRGAAPDSYSFPARFFLIALRLAIGWHCFVEGMEKQTTPTWSSEVYLRESMGPAASAFRALAGDRLIARATVGEDSAFPAELELDWNNYVSAFADYYKLTSEQVEKAHAILAERKKDALAEFAKAQGVTKISAYPPDLKIDMTMKQRLDEHEKLLDRVRTIEGKFPTLDKDVHAEWKTAKADLAKWRAELKKTIDAETAKLKAGLAGLLTSEQKQEGPMPEPKGTSLASWRTWRTLEAADFLVTWSLLVLGACLLLGLFSRATSLATALLILSFYAAMPPLPGWPESPKLEGHYLLINKTLIEVIALLALTFIATGRWAGLDAILCLCCCGKAKSHTPSPPQAPATPT